MAQDNQEQIFELLKEIKELPPYLQSVVCWVIKHYDVIKEMSGNREITLTKVEQEMEIAKKEREYAAFAVLFLCGKEIEKRERERKENEFPD